MRDKRNLVEMGKVGKALGLKGEMYLIWHGENLPEPGDELYLEDAGEDLEKRHILGVRMHKERLAMRLEGIGDRTSAETLAGRAVFQDKSRLKQPSEDEAFLCDLLGSQIFLMDGTLVGILDHVEFPAGQQIWSISGNAGKEILFPAQPAFIEAFVPGERKIIIAPPPGLLEVFNA